MRGMRIAALYASFGSLPACYHATIDTEAIPSTVVVEQPFASGWIYGLVPPKTVSAASRCTSGVAKVETQLSFLNGLVGVLTLGIYTPMNIKVTCAQTAAGDSGAELEVPAGADDATIRAALDSAADRVALGGGPVLVQFER